MTDRPIIFSAPMVRALLDGRKTQTRRLIKDRGARPEYCGGRYDDRNDPSNWGWEDYDRGEWVTLDQFRNYRFVPYAPGDRLYVREAWRVGAWNQCDGGIAVDYLADNHARKEWLYSPSWTDQVHTRLIEQSRADAEKAGAYRPGGGWEYSWSPGNSPCRPRPSIHMPRWASRLTLTVTEVRVQRLQEISDADAVAEGCKGHNSPCGDHDVAPWEEFHDLWNSLHGPDAWSANPWVVAIIFTVQHGNIDQIGGAA